MVRFARIAFIAVTLCATTAFAQTPGQLVQDGNQQVDALAIQPASPLRDSQLASVLDQLFDYDEIARRCLQGHWSELRTKQQTEVTQLLARIFRASHVKNIIRMHDFKLASLRVSMKGPDVIVHTQMVSARPQSPTIDLDYVLVPAMNAPFHLVDVVVQGSSSTANYYRAIHGMLTTPGEGYNFVVQKLKDKLALMPAFTSNWPVIMTTSPLTTPTSHVAPTSPSTSTPNLPHITDP